MGSYPRTPPAELGAGRGAAAAPPRRRTRGRGDRAGGHRRRRDPGADRSPPPVPRPVHRLHARGAELLPVHRPPVEELPRPGPRARPVGAGSPDGAAGDVDPAPRHRLHPGQLGHVGTQPRPGLRAGGLVGVHPGFVTGHSNGSQALDFMAAGSGLVLVAVEIAYLPALYGAYNRRETLVTLLESPGRGTGLGPGADHPAPPGRDGRQHARPLRRLGTLGCGRRREPHQLPVAHLPPLAPTAELVGRQPDGRARRLRHPPRHRPRGRAHGGPHVRAHGLHLPPRHRPGAPAWLSTPIRAPTTPSTCPRRSSSRSWTARVPRPAHEPPRRRDVDALPRLEGQLRVRRLRPGRPARRSAGPVDGAAAAGPRRHARPRATGRPPTGGATRNPYWFEGPGDNRLRRKGGTAGHPDDNQGPDGTDGPTLDAGSGSGTDADSGSGSDSGSGTAGGSGSARHSRPARPGPDVSVEFQRLDHRFSRSHPSTLIDAGSSDEMAGAVGVQPEPPGGQDPQEVGVGHTGHVPGHSPDAGDDPVDPFGHLGEGLASGAPSSKRFQPGRSLADLGRGPALVGAVVPLVQVRVEDAPPGPALGGRSPANSAVSTGPAETAGHDTGRTRNLRPPADRPGRRPAHGLRAAAAGRSARCGVVPGSTRSRRGGSGSTVVTWDDVSEVGIRTADHPKTRCASGARWVCHRSGTAGHGRHDREWTRMPGRDTVGKASGVDRQP